MPPKRITAAEAAEIAGCHRRTIIRAAESAKFRSWRGDGETAPYMLDEAEVRAWARERKRVRRWPRG